VPRCIQTPHIIMSNKSNSGTTFGRALTFIVMIFLTGSVLFVVSVASVSAWLYMHRKSEHVCTLPMSYVYNKPRLSQSRQTNW
jgi:hypothetical protein